MKRSLVAFGLVVALFGATEATASFYKVPLCDRVRQAELIVAGKITKLVKGKKKEGKSRGVTFTSRRDIAVITVARTLKGSVRDKEVALAFYGIGQIPWNIKRKVGDEGIWLLRSTAKGQDTYTTENPVDLQPYDAEKRICRVVAEQKTWRLPDNRLICSIRSRRSSYKVGALPSLVLSLSSQATPGLLVNDASLYESRIEADVRRPNGGTLRHIVSVGRPFHNLDKSQANEQQVTIPHLLEGGTHHITIRYIIQPKGVWSCDTVVKSNRLRIDVPIALREGETR